MANKMTAEYMTHAPYLKQAQTGVKITDLAFGDVVLFGYKNEQRLVFVLNPDYQGHLHGLDMSKVDRDGIVGTVLPPMYGTDDPMTFYQSNAPIKELVKDTDSYRTYTHLKITNLVRMTYDVAE